MPARSRPARAARPNRTAGFGTTAARGATFANQTRGTGIGAISPLAGAMHGKFGDYTPICRSWINLTLSNPFFAPKVNFHNVGTGPELVTCGYFLARNYIPERNITFQEDKIIIDDRTRFTRKLFVVDVEVDSIWGELIYLNIDGAYFHTRTELQQFKDHIRDVNEGRTGRAVDVPDWATHDEGTFVSFLQREQVVA